MTSTTEPSGSAAGSSAGRYAGSFDGSPHPAREPAAELLGSDLAPLGFWLLIGILATFAAAKAVRFDTLDPDCFWHLRVADQLVRDGVGPVVDHLSFSSRPEPWTPYSWGAELAMRAVWHAGGYRAAVATQAVLQATFVMLLGGACADFRLAAARRAGLRPSVDAPSPALGAAAKRGIYASAALATAVGVYLSLPYLSFRPVTLALVLMAAALWLTLRDRRCGGRAVWLVVPLTVLLANVHLYAVLMPAAAGLLLLGDWIDGRPMRRMAWLAATVAIASIATPMLPGVLRTALFYGTRDAMVSGPIIAEMRPWGRDVGSIVLLAGLLAGVGRSRAPTGLLLWTAAAALGALTLGRFAPVLALAACPPLAAGLPSLSDRALTRRPVVVALSVVLLGCVGRITAAFPARAVPLSSWLDRLGPDAPGYPCAAADFVADHVAPATGHLINEFTWGGYLGWRLGDRWQVLLDGRTQVFPPRLWRETYLGSDADCRSFLADARADAAVLPVRRSRFRSALLAQGWTVAHRDDRADVLVPPLTTADVCR